MTKLNCMISQFCQNNQQSNKCIKDNKISSSLSFRESHDLIEYIFFFLIFAVVFLFKDEIISFEWEILLKFPWLRVNALELFRLQGGHLEEDRCLRREVLRKTQIYKLGFPLITLQEYVWTNSPFFVQTLLYTFLECK